MTLEQFEMQEVASIQRKKSKRFAEELELKNQLEEMYDELPFHNGYTNFNDFVIGTIGRELDL